MRAIPALVHSSIMPRQALLLVLLPAAGDGPDGRRSALPTLIGLGIAIESPYGYIERRERRSTGEYRLNLICISGDQN